MLQSDTDTYYTIKLNI